MGTSHEEMALAVLEGVAFALRGSMEVARSLGIAVERTKICGGGARSELWRKMVASVLNVTVETLENEEGPALGAAMLAAVACGKFGSVAEAERRVVKVVDVAEPQKELAMKYETRYQMFRKIYPALKQVFKDLRD